MRGWRLHLKASRLIGGADFTAAACIYKDLINADPTDAFALGMLAHCYEQLDCLPEALRLAEEGVRLSPQSLMALRTAARLSVASDRHERATEYLRQALALPEVRNEIPKEGALPKPLLWILRVLARLPVLGKRLDADSLKGFEAGAQAAELQEWKRWAQEYVAWREGSDAGGGSSVVH